MYSENYYILVLRNGEVCDFDKRCNSLEECIPNFITFEDKHGMYLAFIPRDNIWTIFSSALETHTHLQMFTVEELPINSKE